MTASAGLQCLDRFRKAMPIGDHHAWLADPDDVVAALTAEGFEEYRHETIRFRRDRRPVGGMWQALQRRTGQVASVVWLSRGASRPAVVFVDVDEDLPQEPATRRPEGWWDELDVAVLDCLSDETSMAPSEVGQRLGISEEAAMSVISMLVQEGKVRICLVAAAESDLVERSFCCATRGEAVTVQFVEAHAGSKPLAVKWCTAFDPPTAVDCARDCLTSAQPAKRQCDVA